jgi:hypothetical protein
MGLFNRKKKADPVQERLDEMARAINAIQQGERSLVMVSDVSDADARIKDILQRWVDNRLKDATFRAGDWKFFVSLSPDDPDVIIVRRKHL